jgi:GalNAc-alpha-(1->4)-GalNAc-alpha-(1->3)-diNAcBac-PP-undecaprenol alpha-1,4-N-acetyl-D-galactosaminyltransferase
MERVMSELARYFCQKDDLEVHLVLFGKEPIIFYNLPDNLIIHKPRSKFNNRFRHISAIRRLLFLRHSVAEINPYSILSFGEYWNSFVLVALLGLSYPIFISDRCSPERELSILHTLLRRYLYPRARGVIALTEQARQFYKSQYRHSNICVIGNPIRQIDGKGSSIVKENIVLTVGRLISTKHHDKLIELFANLPITDWKLIIVGEDAQKQNNFIRLKELVNRLNADGKIILAGKQTDVDTYFLRSKIFVFTSSSEGFPNVIGEAMSAGLPVVSFDCIAGPSELINNGKNGFLLPLFDFEGLKEKLILLMNNKELRNELGVNARNSLKNYHPSVIGEKYYQFIIK